MSEKTTSTKNNTLNSIDKFEDNVLSIDDSPIPDFNSLEHLDTHYKSKKHDDKIKHHVSRSDAHDDHAAQHDKGDPKKIGKGHSGTHSRASEFHGKAQQAHALAKKAALLPPAALITFL